MSVKVKFYSLFKLNLKTSGAEYKINSPITVSDLLKKLDEDFDEYFSEKLLEAGTITPGSIILINGQNIFHIDKLNSKIKDGDTVTLFPPSAGG